MNFENPNIQNGDEQMVSREKREELVKRIGTYSHEYMEKEREIASEVSRVLGKPEYRKRERILAQPDEFLTPEDYRRYKELQEERNRFIERGTELVGSCLLVFSDPSVEWRRMPPIGVPGSLSETNARDYRTAIGGGWNLKIGWSNYPPDEVLIGQSETHRQSFGVSIVYEKSMARTGPPEPVPQKKWFRRRSREASENSFTSSPSFPVEAGINVFLDSNGNVEKRQKIDSGTSHPDAEKHLLLEEALVKQGKKLREQLG